jgi:hypothetical protein
MHRKLHPLFLVLLGLIGIGIVYQLILSPSRLIIPLAVFAVVFLLYKFPPGGLRRSRPYKSSAAAERSKPKSKSSQRKSVPFRVIEGGKDDDNLPKYH